MLITNTALYKAGRLIQKISIFDLDSDLFNKSLEYYARSGGLEKTLEQHYNLGLRIIIGGIIGLAGTHIIANITDMPEKRKRALSRISKCVTVFGIGCALPILIFKGLKEGYIYF